MSDILRWRYGETNPVVLPVESATVIEIGDLVYLETDDAKPASSLADQGTEAQNQEAFHDKFAGVAMQRSRAGDTTPIRVATRGVFEFPCPSATFEVGALIGASDNGGGNGLERPAGRRRGHRKPRRRPLRQARQPGRDHWCWSTSSPPYRHGGPQVDGVAIESE